MLDRDAGVQRQVLTVLATTCSRRAPRTTWRLCACISQDGPIRGAPGSLVRAGAYSRSLTRQFWAALRRAWWRDASGSLRRTALSAERILADDGQAITFAYRDNQGRPGTVRLSPERFLHRFLQHVLPRSLQRIRHFGFLSAAATAQWQRVLALQDCKPLPRILPPPRPPPLCPTCNKPMALIGRLARAPPR